MSTQDGLFFTKNTLLLAVSLPRAQGSMHACVHWVLLYPVVSGQISDSSQPPSLASGMGWLPLQLWVVISPHPPGRKEGGGRHFSSQRR